jgi:formylglycine-generating enzyme required for sulfatase activity
MVEIVEIVLAMGLLVLGSAPGSPADPTPAVGQACYIDGGRVIPQYTLGDKPVPVAPFRLARYPVTNAQYLDFVLRHPEWRRSRVKRVFAEGRYLQHWNGDLSFDPDLANSPVVNVSWFAARAYCLEQKGRLPTQDEWELAGQAGKSTRDGSQEEGYRRLILDWYSRPTPPRQAPVGSTFENYYGLYDMHGLVWEWVDDFNTILLTGDSRADDNVDRELYCAAGVSGSTDPSDYAAYMRYGFRSSLKASYTTSNLGFRCAWDVP